MEQTQILRKENEILFTDDEIKNVFKAHGLTFNELTKDLLSKGEWSDILENIQLDHNTDKHGKIKLNREKDGTVKVNYQFHQEQLVIPKKIGDYVLTEDDKLKLNNNEIVGPIKYENNDLYIRVDPDLNAVTVRTAKEISIPNVIGQNKDLNFNGYTLTDQDKNKLANGGALPTKLFCGKDGYFIANFSITDDKKGVVFTNIRSVPLNKVKEVETKYNLPSSDLTNNVIIAGKETLAENRETTILENITHSSTNVIGDSNRGKKAQDLVVDNKSEPSPLKDNPLNREPNLSKEFYDAIEKHDFKKLNELSERGWKPSDKEIKGLDKKEHLTPNDKIAVKSIFNIENKPENSAGISKTEQKYKAQLKFQAGQEQKKSSGRGKKAKDIINRAFNDM